MNETIYKILIVGESTNSSIAPLEWDEKLAEIVHEPDYTVGLEIAKDSLSWDLIILDIEKCGLEGLQIINVAKASNPWISVIVVSDYNKVEYTIESVKNHADGILFKPLQKVALFDLAFKLIHEGK